MTNELPPVAALCGDGPGRRTGPKLTVSLNPYVCPWCDGEGRWNADGERCMNCSGAGVTDDPTPGVDIDGNEIPAVPLPRPPAVMRSPCVDCAYRPGSPEEDSPARPDASVPFYCHHGMHRVGDGYQAAAWVGGMPLGYMVCAGWWALATGQPLPDKEFRDPGGSDRRDAAPDP